MQTYRGFKRDLERAKQGKPDWRMRIAVIGGSVVIVEILILIIKLIVS